MAGDRDLDVAVATAWGRRQGRPLSGWEPTAATGVRGLRLVHESGAFARLLLTEASDEAMEVLRANAAPQRGAEAEQRDGRVAPLSGPFDYVDLDPYGSPVPFVSAALESVRPGGVLAVTATDMMVLAGVQPGACERKYGARPIRGRLGPEAGLRILLAYLAGRAAERTMAVRPLLAYTREHHVRAFVRLTPAREGICPEPIGQIDPGAWSGPTVGDRGPYGPLWLGPLFDSEFVQTLSVPPTAAEPGATARFLRTIGEEVTADVPFYFEANRLAAALTLPAPPPLARFLDELRRRGYRAARTNARPEGFRTDAPRSEVETIARELGENL